MIKPRVVLHIGPMKTGTTALGAYFSAATAAGQLPLGVMYPMHPSWFPASGNITKHSELADYLYPSGRQNWIRKTAFRSPEEVESMVESVAAEAAKRAGAAGTVIFVSETLSSRPHPERMVELLSKYFSQITLVLAVRSPVEAARSYLVHKVKEWESDQLDLNLFELAKDGEDTLGFDYERIIRRWKEFPGVSLELIPYFEEESDGYAIVDRLMNLVTGQPPPRLTSDFGSRRIHPSLPLKSLLRLIALKKADRRFGRLRIVSSLIHRVFQRTLFADREKVVRAGLGLRSTESGDWVIPEEDRRRVLSQYGDLGAVLRKQLGNKAKTAEWRAWFDSSGI